MTMAVVARRAVVFCAGLAVAVLGLVVPASMIAAQVEPPQRGQPFDTLWLSVGDVRDLDASSAFVGSVDAYTATSDNEAAVSVSMTGSVVRLTAVASGVAFIEVSATNAGGSTSQWIGVVSRAAEAVGEEPSRDNGGDSGEGSATSDAGESDTGDAEDMQPIEDDEPPPNVADDGDADASDNAAEARHVGAEDVRPLTVILVAPEFCLGTPAYGSTTLEQFAAFRADRNTVHRFDLSFAVVGGRAPYVVTSPDALDPAFESSGVLRMACAAPDPASVGGERLYFAERLRWTFTVEVTDADGAKANASVLMKFSSGLFVIDNGDGTETKIHNVGWLAEPGYSYMVGFPALWTHVTLAPSLELDLQGLDADGIAHFADSETGWEVWLDSATGREVARTVGTIPDSNPAIEGTYPSYPVEDMDPCLPSEEGCESS